MTRRLRVLAVFTLVALISAGCGTGSSSGGNKNAAIHAKAVEFAECMRDNGVSAFPDPDASGSLTLDGVVNGSSIDTSSAAWTQAIRACNDLEPPGFTGKKATPKQQSARLRFARCIRDHGVKDFPDPADGEPLVDTRRIPSANAPGGMTILNAAMHTCGDIIASQLGR